MTLLVVVLARCLGDSGYGAFAATTSLAGFVATFCGLGAGPLHVREVSLGKANYRVSLDRLTRLVVYTAPALIGITLIAAWALLPGDIPTGDVVMLVIGEFCMVAVADASMRAMQSRERYVGMAAVICAMPAIRLAAASAVALSGHLVLHSWSLISLSTGATALTVFALIGIRRRSHSDRESQPTGEGMLAGLGFALSWASSRIHGDADKVLLARLVSSASAGHYAIAYRLTDVLTLPIIAGAERLLPHLFQQGENGFVQGVHRARHALTFGIVFALALSFIGYLAAPILPWLLGPAYATSVTIARSLALVPFSMTLWIIFRTLAATSGHQHATGFTELLGAGFNVAATTLLILRWGWMGAVAATYMTHFAMIIILSAWLLMTRKDVSHKRTVQSNV